MENLSKEYLLLFNTLTEVERLLRELRERVIRAQQAAEELYISGGQPEAGNPREKPQVLGKRGAGLWPRSPLVFNAI